MLFESCHIGGINAACRIVRSATFEGKADAHGLPTQKLTDMYTTLADGGVGVMITGMMAVSKLEPRQHCQIRIDDDDCIAPLAQMVEGVHAHGGKIVAQIVIMGSSIMLPEGEGRTIISPSGITEKIGRTIKESQALTFEQIKRLIRDAAAAAVRAKKAGFDGVQFHGAHGYLASKFLSPFFNHRTDSYGGTLQNRARFLLDCIRAMRAAVGPDYPIWVKLNSADYMKEGSFTFEECKIVAKWLAEASVNALEISGGNMSSLPRKGPLRAIRRTKEPMYFEPYAKDIAMAFTDCSMDVGVVGGFRNWQDMEQVLEATDLAFISMSRPLLRQPDLPHLWESGDNEPATCISCSRCFGAEDVDCVFHKKEEVAGFKKEFARTV